MCVSIVIQTVGRESIHTTLSSINSQDFDKNIQILVGLDVDLYGNFIKIIDDFKNIKKDNIEITIINPGYSTSVRHGGPHTNHYGGSLRTALSFLAKYRYVCFLDDDDRLEPNHVSSMFEEITSKNASWCFSLCNFATENEVLGKDTEESVGPNKGCFNGFVRPSALMIDKIKCGSHLHLLSESVASSGDGEDRRFFNAIKSLDYAETNLYTVNYVIDPKDAYHALRQLVLLNQGVDLTKIKDKHQTTR